MVLLLMVTTTPRPKVSNASRPPPQARPPGSPAPPAPAIAALCISVQPLIAAVPLETWMAPLAAPLGPGGLGAGLMLLSFPLPPMAWLWSNVLALTTRLVAPVTPRDPLLRMAPPTPIPGRTASELSLLLIARLWLNVLLVTVKLPP